MAKSTRWEDIPHKVSPERRAAIKAEVAAEIAAAREKEREKPLHVRVAEALGCKPEMRGYGGGMDWDCLCKEHDHGEHRLHNDCHDGEGLGCDDHLLTRYDTDWAATGPLIEKYKVILAGSADGWIAAISFGGIYGDFWVDTDWDLPTEGATPLLAVCNLILALAKENKL